MRPLQMAPRVGALAAAIASCFVLGAQANPTGPTVASGQVSILRNANLLQITNSPNSIINWQSFSIGAGEITRFIQQSNASAVLNRVTTQNPSLLLGSLQSNGRVFLLNPSGIVFGPGSQIDVGGLVASSLNLSNADFLAGKLNFTQMPGAGAIVNQGTINTAQGGNVYLVGPAVTNSGIITSPKGEVILAAGNSVELVSPGTPNLRVEVTAPDNEARNLGEIVADSGRVGIYAGLINHSGTIRADSAQVTESGRIVLRGTKSVTLETTSVLSASGAKAGEIRVLADDTVQVAGRLDASAPNGGDGGFIETSAAKVKIDAGAIITTIAPHGATGTWLIDPNDYTIAASGGDITGSQLSTNLGSTSVTIVSSGGGTAGSGDVNVNDAVSWSANTLTLTAARDVNINAVMTASGTSKLELNPATTNTYASVTDSAVAGGTVKVGFNTDGTFRGRVDFGASSATHTLTINDNAYTVINSLTDLQGMTGNLAGRYALGSNIDASATSAWNSNDSGGYYGFAPIGDSGTNFSGVFDGLGHTISSLTINRPATNYVGLFGWAGSPAATAAIRNVGLVDVSVSGQSYVGGLVGLLGAVITSTISNAYSTGTVSGGTNVGGLVGATNAGTVTRSYSTVTVTNGSYAGGLVGFNPGTVAESYSTGNVTGFRYVGGLVGENDGFIRNSYSTGNVHATSNDAYNTAGGLAGSNYGAIVNSYSTGAVSAGALVTKIGGLVGDNGGGLGTAPNSFWDTQTSGRDTSAGGTDKNTAQMKQLTTFSDWDFTNTWRIEGGVSYPTLRAFRAAVAGPAAFIWDNESNDFLWTNPLNWNFNSGLPGSADSVTLNLSGSEARLTSGTYSIGSLTSSANNSLLINGSSLTVLGAATLSGNLAVQSGALTLQGTSSLANYAQSGGTYAGAGNLTIGNSFAHTGGTFDTTGNVSITQATGNFVLTQPLTAGNFTLVTTAGNIVGSGGAVSANNVTLDAHGGIGIGAPVNISTTGILNLRTKGVNSAGDIHVVATKALDTDRITISTDSSAQTVKLGAPSIAIRSDIFDPADDLMLLATQGPAAVSTSLAGTGRLINDVGGTLTYNPIAPIVVSRPVLNKGTASWAAGSNGNVANVTHTGGLTNDKGATITLPEFIVCNTPACQGVGFNATVTNNGTFNVGNFQGIIDNFGTTRMSSSLSPIAVYRPIHHVTLRNRAGGTLTGSGVLGNTNIDVQAGSTVNMADLSLGNGSGMTLGSSDVSIGKLTLYNSGEVILNAADGRIADSIVMGDLSIVTVNAASANVANDLSTMLQDTSIAFSPYLLVLNKDATFGSVRFPGGDASITVQGAGDLRLAGTSSIGGGSFSGTGRLVNESGGSLTINPSDPLTIDRAVVNRGKLFWSTSPVYTAGTGVTLAKGLINESSGAVFLQNNDNNAYFAANVNNAGTFVVNKFLGKDKFRSRIDNTGWLVLSNLGRGRTITDVEVLNHAGGILSGSAEVWSSFIGAESGSILHMDTLKLLAGLDGYSGASGLHNDTTNAWIGTLELRGASGLTLGSHASTSIGSLNMTGGLLVGSPGGLVDAYSELHLTGNSTIVAGGFKGAFGYTGANGKLINEATGTLTFKLSNSTSPLTVDLPVVNRGILAGTGTVKVSGSGVALLNDGSIAPGGAGVAGTLTILGDVTFGTTGSLNIERFSSTSNDKLAVSGATTLAGSFGLTDAVPSIPSDGSTYTVLTYGSNNGTFTTMNLPAGYSGAYLTDRLNITTPNRIATGNSAVTDPANQVVANLSTLGQVFNQVPATTNEGTSDQNETSLGSNLTLICNK